MVCAHKRTYARYIDGQKKWIGFAELDYIEKQRERERDGVGKQTFYDDDCFLCIDEKPETCTNHINIDCELPFAHDGPCNPEHTCQPCWCKSIE